MEKNRKKKIKKKTVEKKEKMVEKMKVIKSVENCRKMKKLS